MKQTLYLLLLTSLMVANQGFAAVTAKIDRNQVVIGETINLTLSTDEKNNDEPDLTTLEQAFRVLGTSKSSSTQMINGRYSIEVSWQISLMPIGEGKSTIPSIRIGKNQTKEIEIIVLKADPNAKANGDVYIEINADKSSAFVKEQIILTVKLFYSLSLSEGSLTEPNAASTIVTQLDKGTTYTTNRSGKNYTVVERHYALFSEKSGVLNLNPIIFNGRDNSSRRSFSMFSTGKPIRAVSEPLSLEIKPIPQASIGKDWIPATKVNISQVWSKGPFTVGEPITRTITLFVEGLSETQIPDIDLGKIQDIRIYPEQPQTQTEKTPQTIKGLKQVKIAMIPTHEGLVRVPEYSLQWYNTKTDKVEFAKLPPKTLKVDAGEFALEIPVVENLLDKKKKAANNKTSPSNINPEVITIIEKQSPIWKVVAAIFAILWVLTLFIYYKKSDKNNKNDTVKKQIQISKQKIIDAISKKDFLRLERNLVQWWNQQYESHSVTNVNNIKKFVNKDMQQLIYELEDILYRPNNKQKFNIDKWLHLVKAKGLKFHKNQVVVRSSGLPELY